MTAAIVIPARYGSGRLPGKPLLEIRGMTMLERVWRIAKAVDGCTRVVIATEDQRIVDHAASFGAEATLTPDSCRNGTERTYAALDAANIQEEAIINFQGDALLTPPWVLEAMVSEFASTSPFDIVTPAVKLDEAALAEFMAHKKDNPSSGTTVVFNGQNNALYFSKQVIPYLRKRDAAAVHRHIGLYGYTREGLKTYVNLQESLLERTEGLEQLRAIENGLTVRVTLVDYRGRTHASVDNKDDIGLAEQIIDREGELVGA